MTNRTPQLLVALSPQYDEYVADGVALARGELPPEREAAVRARMESDAIYRAVIQPILDTRNAPRSSEARLRERYADFTRRAGLAPALTGQTSDLADFAERTRVRERVWRRRIINVGAVAATIVALMVGSWAYFDSFWTEHRTFAFATMSLELPDGSLVTLEPESKLRHLDELRSGRGSLRRDLYLTGSAGFDVRHIGDARFSVQTHNALVEVVGTRFHVDGRNGRTVVRVDEGRVSVVLVDDMGDKQGAAVTVDAGRTARVVGDRVTIDSTTMERKP